MKHRQGWLIGPLAAVALSAVLALLSPLGQHSLAENGIIYVDADADGSDSGGSWTDAYTSLQAALSAALAGKQIWVAEGIYRPTSTGDRYASFELKNGVAIYGGFDPGAGDIAWEDRDWVSNQVVLSGDIGAPDDASDNSYHVFYHPAGTSLNNTAILDGFTITGGNSNGASTHYYGGGMYNSGSSPALTNITFSGNSAGLGGGMHNTNSSAPTLSDCTFSDNSANYGGGLSNYYSSPVLTDCAFSSNSANYGGGIYNNYSSVPEMTGCSLAGNSASYGGGGIYNTDNSAPDLTDCLFAGNSATYDGGGVYNDGSAPLLTGCTFTNNTAGSDGGGIYNSISSPELAACGFIGNSADYGGGIYNEGSTPTLTGCALERNSAALDGGGIYNFGSSPMLANCTFAGNSAMGNGGGMRNTSGSAPTLTNCTFWGNSANRGGGIHNWSSSPEFTNCILWGDDPEEIYNYDAGSEPVVNYSDVQGGCEAIWGAICGPGNLDALPWFADPANGDVHLTACSQCIDAGYNTPELPPFDFEGDARIVDGNDDGTATVDMGVDEAVDPGICFRLYLPVVLRQS